MTEWERAITIIVVVIATVLTRFLPFWIIGASGETPKYIKYLGKTLPCAIFALLIVYCLKDVNVLTDNHGVPEFIGVFITVVIHRLKRQMLLSMSSGTVAYMFLVQFIF